MISLTNDEQQVEACVQALLEAEDNIPPESQSDLVTYRNQLIL